MRKAQPFGKYLLLDRIAVGGMAEVFAAKAFGVEGFERVIAIKRILPTMVEDDEFIKMFIDEARIASQLSHANLVQIYDLGKHEDTYYIAMEYVSGRDVRLIIDKFKKRNETVPLAMAAYIMAKMCEGLDYAHRRKDAQGRDLSIIHRDISPQNVLVSYEGEVKIIDFGIAKAAGRAQKTQAGILKGKFGYMSPEQVRGMEIDHRTDIYSCGVMLYEMITGTKLFTGESDFSTLEKVRAGEVRPPTEVNAEIPPDLEEIVLKALAKNRDERYQWASELGDDLMRFLYRSKDVFTGKTFAAFMKDAFGGELVKEGDRQRRWQNTTAEETSDFELTPLSQSLEVLKPGATPEPAQSGRARIGPPSAFSTAELRLQDRTTVSQPFDDGAAQRANLATEAISLSELGMMVGDPGQLPDSAASKDRASLPFDVDARKRAASRPPPSRAEPVAAAEELGDAPIDQQATRVRAEPLPRSKPAAAEKPKDRAAEPPAAAPEVQQPPTRAVSVAKPAGRASGLAKGLVAAGAVVALLAIGLGLRAYQSGQRGQLRLTVRPPNAKVLVDGKSQPSLPLIVVRLPLGEHTLEVSADGHAAYDESFAIDSTKPLELTVELQKIAGTTTAEPAAPEPAPEPAATSQEPAAVASAALPRPAVAPGRPAAGVVPAVARPAAAPAPVPEPAPAPAPEPEPEASAGGEDGAPGGFAIFTTPPGAMVAIDRRFVGKSPTRVSDLIGGKEVGIKLVLAGYKPVEMRKVVTGGKTESLKIEMEAVEGGGSAVSAETFKALGSGGGGGGGGTGKLTAMCMPKAQVFVDGKPTGRTTPVTQGSPLELSVGTHKVHCESETGARSEPKDVEITADAVASFRDRLPQ